MRFRRGNDLDENCRRSLNYLSVGRVIGQQVNLTMGLAELADIRIVDSVMVGLPCKLRGGVQITWSMFARVVWHHIAKKEKQIRDHPQMECHVSNLFV